jgi:hypothetical protein
VPINYPAGSADPLAADQAAIAAGVAEAFAAVQTTQAEAAAFIVEHGADVLGGHSAVGEAGRQGDPDSAGADASDSRG